MDRAEWKQWIGGIAERVAARVDRDLPALVDVSSPSGDAEAAESVVAVARALLPERAEIERLPCSSPDHADDLLAHLRGDGEGRLLLLGHLDTVIPHSQHHPLRREDGLLRGPGTIDMKGGVALSIAAMHALATIPGEYAEIALLLVVDEEWRSAPFAHAARFGDHDACLCFEGGDRDPEGTDAVVVARKAAGTVRVGAEGVASHSGSEPDAGRNALLALAEVASLAARSHDPDGLDRLTVVPTILRSGEAFNIVPGSGELYLDARGQSLGPIEELIETIPGELGGVRLSAELIRRWPAMDMLERARGPLEFASELIDRPIVGIERGGASDASHLAAGAPLLAIDGLGPLGGGSHAPDEHVEADSLLPRAEIALALIASVLCR